MESWRAEAPGLSPPPLAPRKWTNSTKITRTIVQTHNTCRIYIYTYTCVQYIYIERERDTCRILQIYNIIIYQPVFLSCIPTLLHQSSSISSPPTSNLRSRSCYPPLHLVITEVTGSTNRITHGPNSSSPNAKAPTSSREPDWSAEWCAGKACGGKIT